MSRTEFVRLAILTAAVLLTTVWVYQVRHTSGDQEYLGALWLEDLDVNAVEGIEIVGPGNLPQVSLERRPEGWGVVERDHYPAQIGKIRGLLLELSEARLLERKTRDPSQLARLGLGDIEQLDARGRQITLHSAAGSQTVRLGVQPGGRNVTYVRHAGDHQGWLVDRIFTLPPESRLWLDPMLLDIGMEQLRRIKITHPDGEILEGVRAEGEDVKFLLSDIPDGAVLKSEFALNRTASAITSLSLEDVMPIAQAQTHLDGAAGVEYELLQGYTLEARLFPMGAERYARFTVRLGEGMSEAARAEAARLSRFLEGWAFRIPTFAFSSMALRWADILESSDAE